MAENKNSIAQRVDQTPSMDRLAAADLVSARHNMMKGVLTSLSMSFNSTESMPTTLTIQNTIWAVQEMLDQAYAAVKRLELCD